MSHDLAQYHRILFTICPWVVNDTISDDKYRQLLNDILYENFANPTTYKNVFPKPLTPKTKYFHTIISNEAAGFLNSVYEELRQALNDNEKKYHVRNALLKIAARLRETAKIIVGRQLFYSLLTDLSVERKDKDNAFIIQYLKYWLIQLYLEVQDNFYEYNVEQEFSPQEISGLYFNEPFEHMLIKAGDTEATQLKSKKLRSDKSFKVIKGDFRPGLTPKGILSYDEIIANAHRFAIAEEELFNVELIDENYDFTDKHTEKQKLAAVYHVFIRKGYFKRRNLAKLRNVKLVDIRKFLDHRYNTNVDSQFRTWKNKPDKLAAYLEKFPWMDHLPHA